MKEDEKRFIEELAALTRKYGIAIGGCGCCGSPFLVGVEDTSSGAGYYADPCSTQDIEWVGSADPVQTEHPDRIVR